MTRISKIQLKTLNKLIPAGEGVFTPADPSQTGTGGDFYLRRIL